LKIDHNPTACVEKGADINAKDNSGRIALMIASENGHAQIVELLKAHGVKD
jgi:ankyrin repeat protein